MKKQKIHIVLFNSKFILNPKLHFVKCVSGLNCIQRVLGIQLEFQISSMHTKMRHIFTGSLTTFTFSLL